MSEAEPDTAVVRRTLISAVRLLLDELNAGAAAGLISQHALVLIGVVQREMSRVKT